MGLFQKLGSFVSALTAGAPPKKEGSHAKAKSGLAKRRGTFAPRTQDQGGQLRDGNFPTSEDMNRRAAEQAEAVRPLEDHNRPAPMPDRPPEIDTSSTPELRFIHGEITEVISSNVNWIQYDKENELLYIQFRNMACYVYYGVDLREAISLFWAPSKGTWVWDNLRVRGTAFGYKHDYAFLSWSGSGYQPKYMSDEGYVVEHAAIPPSGEPPASWRAGSGPYADLPWYNKSPGKESEPHQLPTAKLFDEPKGGGLFKS